MEKYRLKKANIIVGLFCTLFLSLFIFLIGTDLSSWFHFKKTAVPVQATITNIEKEVTRTSSNKRKISHYVDVEYEYNGEQYNGPLGYYVAGMYVGQEVTIYCNPENPGNAATSPYISCIILSLFSLIFVFVFYVTVIKELKHANYINNLIAGNSFVICDNFTENKANITVNNVRYRYAHCTYTDNTGREFEFSSEPYHPNKSPFVPGQKIKVYVDIANDATKYYVSKEHVFENTL